MNDLGMGLFLILFITSPIWVVVLVSYLVYRKDKR